MNPKGKQAGNAKSKAPASSRASSPASITRDRAAKTEDIVVPDKLFFRIGEVARLCRLPAYVLRFWETQFPQLKPNKSSSGQRLYRKREVETALEIKKLLYQEGFTIPGARQHLRQEGKGKKSQDGLPFPTPATPKADLKRLRHNLEEILKLLSSRR